MMMERERIEGRKTDRERERGEEREREGKVMLWMREF